MRLRFVVPLAFMLATTMPTAAAGEIGAEYWGFGPCVRADFFPEGAHVAASGWVGCGICLGGPCTSGLWMEGVEEPAPEVAAFIPDEYRWVSDPITGTCVGAGTKGGSIVGDIDFTGECGTGSWICARLQNDGCRTLLDLIRDNWPPRELGEAVKPSQPVLP